MSDISLSKAVRSNLLSLQNTSDLMSSTQNRLATGKKVNSALDNPSNFFTASSLNSRAGDMNQLLDSMANGIQTLEAADNGLKAITKTLESMQSTLRQARQDKSFQTTSFELGTVDTSAQQSLSLSGGAIGSTAVDIDLVMNPGVTAAAAGAAVIEGGAFTPLAAGETASFTVSDGTNSFAVTLDDTTGASLAAAQASIQQQLDDNGVNVTVGTNSGGDGFSFTSTATGTDATVAISAITEPTTTGQTGLTVGTESGTAAIEGARARTVDELVNAINSNADINTAVRATNDNGKLRIENQSTQDLTVGGVSEGQITGASGEAEIGGNTVRAGLADQFRELRDQLDKLADDASFNGINLLRGDNLQITFNETGTSELNIRSKDGESINSGSLNIQTNLQASDLDSDTAIDGFLGEVKEAINQVRAQSSSFGSSLSVVQNRQDFTKNMINTLQTGAANLTLADSNEEAANLLALQTRQQLSSTALSMASQADQAVLRLF
jgi:flagellin